MPKFVKRPIVVKAEKWIPGDIVQAGRLGLNGYNDLIVPDRVNWGVSTLEGFMVLVPGDWIVTGVKGERYPVKADIFAETYSRVPCHSMIEPCEKSRKPEEYCEACI